jgi:hypothetical protein
MFADIYFVNIGTFEKFIKSWNSQIETRQNKLSAKLAAMALEIAGPICVEQTQIAQEVRNDFANRTDDLDDFPAPTNAGSQLTQLEIGNTQAAGGTPSTLAGNRQSTPAGESTLASQCTQPSEKKRSNPTAANDAGSKRRKIKVCLVNVSTL